MLRGTVAAHGEMMDNGQPDAETKTDIEKETSAENKTETSTTVHNSTKLIVNETTDHKGEVCLSSEQVLGEALCPEKVNAERPWVGISSLEAADEPDPHANEKVWELWESIGHAEVHSVRVDNDLRWYLPISLDGREADFLIDSGATCCALDKAAYDQLEHPPKLLASVIRVNAANSQAMRVYGKVLLSFRIGTKDFKWPFLVMDLNSHEGIIGADFGSMFNGCLEQGTGSYRLQGVQYPCSFKDYSDIAVMEHNIRLRPHSMTWVEVGWETSQNGDTLLLPDYEIELGVLALPSLVSSEKQKSLIPVMNMTGRSVPLNKGMEVAFVHDANFLDLENIDIEEEVETYFVNTLDKLDDKGETCWPEFMEKLLEEAESPSFTHKQSREKLNRFVDLFVPPGQAKTGLTEKVKHMIKLLKPGPVRCTLRRVAPGRRTIIEEAVKDMWKNDVIEPSHSSWSSPVVLAKKKDGSIRFCVDFRKLNDITEKDAFPIPRIDDCLDALGGNEYFCTLDLQSGYWQIAMNENAKTMTAFATQMGLYQFKVMPFGLCNAPATFQRMMEEMLGGLRWTKCLVYLDDIIIFGKTLSECEENLCAVLERIREYGLKLKPSKCKLFQKSVKFLGRIVSKEGIATDPEKTEAVQNWPVPETIKQVRGFVGLAGFYRQYVKDFSGIAVPLKDMLRGNKPKFYWNEKCQVAFEKLKKMLVTPPVLGFPTDSGHYILDTDASGESISAVLSQIQNDKEVVIAYSSNSMNKSQRNYCATHRELLAIVVNAKKFSSYLWGTDFTVRTDHASLKWLMNFRDANGMLARWISILSEFGITAETIEHRAGNKHTNADALSRKPIAKCNRQECVDCGSHQAIIAEIVSNNDLEPTSTSVVLEEQQKDKDISRLTKHKEDGNEPPTRPAISAESKEFRMLCSQWEDLEVNSGILCLRRKNRGTLSRKLVPVMPMSLRYKLFELIHLHPTGGHFGRMKTLFSLRNRCYWPGQRRDLDRWMAECTTCHRTKSKPPKGKSPLKQELTGSCFGRIALDILGGLQTTDNGNRYLMVIQDYFSKWVVVIPLPDQTAVTCADALMKRWILIWGTPRIIHTDQGPNFESKLWAELCQRLGIEKTHTNPYRPQSDGMVEKFNSTLITSLKAFMNDNRTNWDDMAEYIASAYRGTEHASTHISPDVMLHGQEKIMAPDMVYGVQPNSVNLPCENVYVEGTRRNLHRAHEYARQSLGKAAVYQKRYYDTGLCERVYQPGALVMRYYVPNTNIKGLGEYDGPWKVVEHVGKMTYRIEDAKGKQIKWHVDQLVPLGGKYGVRNVARLQQTPQVIAGGGLEKVQKKLQKPAKKKDSEEKAPRAKKRKRGRPPKKKIAKNDNDSAAKQQKVVRTRTRTIRPPIRFGN